MRRSKDRLSPSQLLTAFIRLDDVLQVDSSDYSFFKKGSWHARVETRAHDIAHWIALERPDYAMYGSMGTYIEIRLGEDAVTNEFADHQEALTCAIEHSGLCRLGMPFPLVSLAKAASKMTRGVDNFRTDVFLDKINSAKRTAQARNMTNQFVRLVRRYALCA